jgi:hypothetical protein
MRRCVMALPPAHWQTARPIWRRARVAWRALAAAVSDPYRPEQHYMRGPGPKCRERQDRKGAG